MEMEMEMSSKRKRTETSEHMQIDYPPLRNPVKGRENPYKPTLVVVKQEDKASVPHPGIDVVFGDQRIVHTLDGYGGRLWAQAIGPVEPFISGLHYLCTIGPNRRGAPIQWFESPHLPGYQAVRLNKFDEIISKLRCDDKEDFIRNLKSYGFKTHYQKSHEHCRHPYEVIDFWHAGFNMNTLLGLEIITKVPTDQKAIREELQLIEDRFQDVHKRIDEIKGDGKLISYSLYQDMSGLQVTLEDMKEDVREVKNSIYEI